MATAVRSSQVQVRTHFDQRRIASSPTVGPATYDRFADFTRDEAIDSSVVQVKQADGKLGEPEPLRRLLNRIDRQSQTVVQLGKSDERGGVVVQVYEKIELLRKIRERELEVKQQQQAQREKKPKTIELNWAIGRHDLELKMKQLEQFLEKGKKVEIMLAAKKHQRKATSEEGEELLKAIREKLGQVNAKEIKPMDGQPLKQATMTVKKV